ncbi:hypothetical protein LOTGIDRAFT_236494 [Lottia gigantea]|uniref:Uncharacterized protein n=1 Tax=Lottia gigantea TaxID=225164 RepID=V3ZRY6_LOTGI|nr:hypothetical protein LOTGIDRAFT_236494 [Lottia gigantea]ESO83651.1 hypothetical protein LOTGIDRAFT_236494 [Lottia gigantea]
MDTKVQLPAFLQQIFNATKEESEVDLSSVQSQKPQNFRLDRTSMGEYIVPEGEKPLTSLGIPGPGPADYSPEIRATRYEPPHYSVAGKYKVLKPKKAPGPANYSTGRDLKWKDRHLSLKGRTTSIYDDEAAKSASDIGPARYNVRVNEVGSTGPRYSMRTRHQDAGLKNSLIQPADVAGFETPGPNNWPSSGYWRCGPQKSFGNSRKTISSQEGPGPADYTIGNPESGPAYSLAKRLQYQDVSSKENVPAPNVYDVGSTIGQAVAKSMTARREDLQAQKYGPSPNSYYVKSTMLDTDKAKTMKYRWFDRNDEYHPGPGDYEVKPKVIQERHPAYSCRHRTKLSYPVSKYSGLGPESSPGPANYNLTTEFLKNDRPAFSIGHRSKTWQDIDGPGPNEYNAEKYPKPGAQKAPAFSMGKRINRLHIDQGPGPAAYHPVVKDSGPSYTITKRSKPLKKFTNPSPNKYTPPSEQTHKGLPTKMGTSFKSRASPWIYSGFKTNKLYNPIPS